VVLGRKQPRLEHGDSREAGVCLQCCFDLFHVRLRTHQSPWKTMRDYENPIRSSCRQSFTTGRYMLSRSRHMTFSWTSIVQLSGSTRPVPAAVYYSTFNAYEVSYVFLTPCWKCMISETVSCLLLKVFQSILPAQPPCLCEQYATIPCSHTSQ